MTEPVLLIPGLMCDARLFLHQILHLSRHRPVTVALPLEPTVEDMSERLLAGAPARFALVGHGLGGAVALDLFRRAPERVTRIALLGCDPMAESPQAAAMRELRMVAARAGRLVQAMTDDFPDAALAEGSRAATRATLTEMALTLGDEVYQTQSRAMQRRPDLQKIMRRAMLPALVIAGAADTIVTLRRQDLASSLMPYGKLKVIEGAGHFAPLEQPEAVTEALEGFLSALR